MLAASVISLEVMQLFWSMTDGTFSLVDARGRRYLTQAEQERFLAAARAHPKPAVRTLAWILAMTGCRVSEIAGIRVRCGL